MQFWSVPKIWDGETVYIIASGPSVRQQNLELLKGKNVIVVNSSWRAFPEAQYLFFIDVRWFRYFEKELQKYEGQLVTVSQAAKSSRLKHLKKMIPPPGLSLKPDECVAQRTSTQGAINLAVHLGAKRIILLGVDMQRAPDGAAHHHSPHPWKQRVGCWDQQISQLILTRQMLEILGIEVINTSLESRVDWWKKCPLEECI